MSLVVEETRGRLTFALFLIKEYVHKRDTYENFNVRNSLHYSLFHRTNNPIIWKTDYRTFDRANKVRKNKTPEKRKLSHVGALLEGLRRNTRKLHLSTTVTQFLTVYIEVNRNRLLNPVNQTKRHHGMKTFKNIRYKS